MRDNLFLRRSRVSVARVQLNTGIESSVLINAKKKKRRNKKIIHELLKKLFRYPKLFVYLATYAHPFESSARLVAADARAKQHEQVMLREETAAGGKRQG